MKDGTPPKSRRLSVVVVTHTAVLGGAELALLRLCDALSESPFLVSVIVFEEGDLVDALRTRGVQVDVITPQRDWVRSARCVTRTPVGVLMFAAMGAIQARKVGAHVRRAQPDVVQSWTLKAHLITTLSRTIHRRPLVWFLHDRVSKDYLGRVNKCVLHLLSRGATAIIANSTATASTMPRPCIIAFPGLAPDQFATPKQLRSRSQSPPPVLLLLGRISPTKGQREAIRAMPLIHRDFPDAILRIVGTPMFGEDGYEAECRDLALQLGVTRSVQFVGHVSDPSQEIDRASVLLHTSPSPEPFGQVVVEAMARGVPVIGTDAGGVPEILHDGQERFGLLVPPGDHAALARAVLDTLAEPAEARHRAARAYHRARTLFTIERTADVVGNVWRAVANRRGAPVVACSSPDDARSLSQT